MNAFKPDAKKPDALMDAFQSDTLNDAFKPDAKKKPYAFKAGRLNERF